MFGTNVIRHRENRADGALAVQEIFYTLQGEGPYAGCPAVFIRLAGCNLACTFCDTEFESKASNYMSARDIVIAAQKTCTGLGHAPMVVLTGGEPLRQNCIPLLGLLASIGVFVQIETAGTLWDHALGDFVINGDLVLVCSPKTVGIKAELAKYCNHYKYIITAGQTSPYDGLPNVGTQASNAHLEQRLYRPEKRDAHEPKCVTWVSPCDAHDAKATGANIEEAVRVALRYGYRLSLQMHKLVGLP